MTEQELIEKLASHAQLMQRRIMNYLLSKCKPVPYDSVNNANLLATRDLIIPAELVDQWQKQIDTPYDDLPEPEKNEARQHVVSHMLVIIYRFVNDKLDTLRNIPPVGESREVLVKWNRRGHANFGEFGFGNDEEETQP